MTIEFKQIVIAMVAEEKGILDGLYSFDEGGTTACELLRIESQRAIQDTEAKPVFVSCRTVSLRLLPK